MQRADSPKVAAGRKIGGEHVIGAGDVLDQKHTELAAEIWIGIDVEVVTGDLRICRVGPIKSEG